MRTSKIKLLRIECRQFGFLVLLYTMAQCAFGAGFYISEVATPKSVGTAGVGNPTNTTGADASWTNPAGMMGIKKDTKMFGIQLLVPTMEFDASIATAGGNNGNNAGEISPVPSFFYTKVLSERYRYGISLVAPFGGGVDYGQDFAGRYAVTRVKLGGIGVTPAVAYRVNNRLSLGMGVSLVYTRLEQDISVRTNGRSDGRVRFEDMEDWGYQPILGLTYQFSSKTLLGLVYRAEADVHLDGDVKFNNFGVRVPTRSLKLAWDNPQWLEVGVSHALSDNTSLLMNAGWQEWSAFSENTLSVSGSEARVLDRDWDNTWHAGVAFVHKINNQSQYTGGISYDSSPVEDDKRTLDFPVDEIWKISGSYSWTGTNDFDFAIGASLFFVGDSEVDQTSQGVRVKGEFDTNMVLIVGGTIRYVFN